MNAVHNLLFDDDNDAEAPGGETSVASQARPHGLQATAQEHAIYAPSPLVHSQPPAPLAAPTPDRAPAAPPPSAAAVAVQPSERNPSSGHTLLSDAVKSGKITQEEAVLLNKTLAEAKRLASKDPNMKPKEFVMSTIRQALGDVRARAVVSAVAGPTPRAISAPPTQIMSVQHLSYALREQPVQSAPAIMSSPPPVAAKPQLASPPGQGPGSDAAAKATKRKGPKSGDDAGTAGKRRPQKATFGVPSANERLPQATAAPIKIDYDLDSVNVDDYQMAGHRPGATGRGAKGEVVSALLEPVLTMDIIEEELKAREERRAVNVMGMRAAGNIMSSRFVSAAHHHQPAPWDSDSVMTRSKILNISDEILKHGNQSMKIDEDAVKCIAFSTQTLLKDIIEASITSSRRRRNQTAVHQFDKIQQLLQLPGNEKGSAIPEHGQNLGMGWGTDIEGKTLSDGLEFVRDYEKRLSEFKEQIKGDLTERKLSGKKRQLSGAANVADTEVPWWTRDEEAMNSGTLSWSEMAMVHLRLKVAEEFELGPSRQRRGRVSRGGNKADDGFEAMDVIEAEGPVVSVTSSGPVSTAFNNTASRQSMESWHPIRCPLYTEDKDVVTKSDVLRNLSKRTKLRYAGGFYMEKLGDSLFRAKLNLPSK